MSRSSGGSCATGTGRPGSISSRGPRSAEGLSQTLLGASPPAFGGLGLSRCAHRQGPGGTSRPGGCRDILLIGGTRFSGRALAEQALAAGHRVTLFHRGNTNAELLRDQGAEHVLGDRKTEIERLRGRRFDAVVDFVGFVPRVVEQSARLLA